MSGEDTGRRRPGLGRGLDALFGGTPDNGEARGADRLRPSRFVPIEHLTPGRLQPRRSFDATALEELAQSITDHGLLQPILVRPVPGSPERFEIVAGERRWRAAQQARLAEVPVVVREMPDDKALELAIIENVQRADLNPLEEAAGYRRLMDQFRYQQDQVAGAVGKSRSHVANTLRLLALPDTVRNLVETGRLSAGHGRALLTAANPEALALEIMERGLNVRQTEQLVREGTSPEKAQGKARKAAAPAPRPAQLATEALERELTDSLGLRVTISRDADGPGILMIDFRDTAQLDGVAERLRAAPRRRSRAAG